MSNLAPNLMPTDLLEAALGSCRGKRAMAFISVANLKDLQNSHGAGIRESLMNNFHRLLNVLLRPQDSLIELADDKVALVLDDLIDVHHLQLAGMKLARIFESPVEVDDLSLKLQVFGGFLYIARPTAAPDLTNLIARTDAALSEAQLKHPTDKFFVATLDDEAEVENHWQIGMRLREAMDAHHIYMDYQPKIDLSNGALAGAEALVRWRHKGAVMPPGEYLPALQSDLMWELTVYCFRRVLRDILDYQIEVPVAINFDPVTISEPDLIPLLTRETSLWGVEPQQLIIEITEVGELLDVEHARTTLTKVHDLGFRISIDDFGAGHSNMDRLRGLPLDELKIDRSFSGNIVDDSQNQAITRSVIDLARSLGAVTVAEGIEDAQTLELLAAWGCNLGQGFYLSAPLPIEALQKLSQ